MRTTVFVICSLSRMPVHMASALQDEALLRSAMGYYRLMAAWLLRLSSPAAAGGAEPELPLPTPPPAAMRFLPVRARVPPAGHQMPGILADLCCKRSVCRTCKGEGGPGLGEGACGAPRRSTLWRTCWRC
jgi:hypothetical protein